MGKRYNYFDDEPVTRPKQNNRSNSNQSKKQSFDAKQMIGTTLVMAKLGSKKAQRVAKSVAKKARNIELPARNYNKWGVLFIVVLTVLAIIVTVFGFMNSIRKENKREELFNTSATDVCLRYEETYGVSNYESLSQYGTTGYRLTGLCYARELDFDSDNRSELLICYNASGTYVCEVWGFDGGDFVQLYKGDATQTGDVKDDAWITVYSKNGKYYICEHSKDDISSVTILALHGDKFSKKTTCTYAPETEEYIIKGEANYISFDRIKLSVLREVAASNQVEKTQDVIETFTGDKRKPTSAGGTQEDNMKRAYFEIVQQYNDTYGVAEYKSEKGAAYVGGLAYVDLIDFNNDGTDEMMLVYRRPVNTRKEDRNGSYIAVTVDKYFCEVYGWNGSNAWRVYQNEGISNSLEDSKQSYIMIKTDGKKPQLCFNQFASSSYGRVINATSKMMAYDGERFEPSFKASYVTEYGYTQYYIDGEKEYKSSFANNGGYSVPMFDGSSTYDSAKYRVIYMQTDFGNASRVKSLPNTTVENIRKLNSSY